MGQSVRMAAGAAVAVGARMVMHRVLLARFRSDVHRLNAGQPDRLLAAYAEDAVLRFHEGDHRWSGTHRGRAAIADFLRDFIEAGLQGEIRELWMGGPPWALTLVARFDDRATSPTGELIYRNRVVLVVRTRWGRIVEQDDFYEDTGRIEALEARLRDLGVPPAARRT